MNDSDFSRFLSGMPTMYCQSCPNRYGPNNSYCMKYEAELKVGDKTIPLTSKKFVVPQSCPYILEHIIECNNG